MSMMHGSPQWHGLTIDGFKKGQPVMRVRTWYGWPHDLDIPLLPIQWWRGAK